ncbi:glycosyltransferase family 2 protein [Kribbella sp. NPDC051587]|uniref:glycosyltransferase family 2 protein n=1 Tax=Kribbella sp. NPDC051587 TaxID=3364119 RepID=UPI00378E2958
MNSSDVRVSVVMPALNAKLTAGEAVVSILEQSEANFEFLILDDGSTDGTTDILDELAAQDPRLRLVKNRSSEGVAAGLNRLAKLARGNYIARMDADDVSHQDRLREQCDLLDRHLNTVLVSCLVICEFAENTDIVARRYYEAIERHRRTLASRGPVEQALVHKNIFHHGEVIFRRAAFDEVGGYAEWMEGVEDYDLWLRMMARGNMRISARELYTRRIYPSSVSMQNRLRAVRLARLARIRNLPMSDAKRELAMQRLAEIL